jgi:hypothetical protein
VFARIRYADRRPPALQNVSKANNLSPTSFRRMAHVPHDSRHTSMQASHRVENASFFKADP